MIEISPISKNQWKSVLRNAIFAFVSAFVPVLLYSDNLDRAAITGGVVAGIMAVLKVCEKSLTVE